MITRNSPISKGHLYGFVLYELGLTNVNTYQQSVTNIFLCNSLNPFWNAVIQAMQEGSIYYWTPLPHYVLPLGADIVA